MIFLLTKTSDCCLILFGCPQLGVFSNVRPAVVTLTVLAVLGVYMFHTCPKRVLLCIEMNIGDVFIDYCILRSKKELHLFLFYK